MKRKEVLRAFLHYINLMSIIILMITFGSTFSAAMPVGINIESPSQAVEKGQDFNINISVEPSGIPVTAMQFNLLFNSAVIEVRNITEGELFKQNGTNAIFNSGTLNNSAGTLVNVWGLITTPGANVTTKGNIATLTLNAKVPGSSSLLLTNVIVSNPDSQAVQIAITNASVESGITNRGGGYSGGSSGGGGGGGGGAGGTSGENFTNIAIKEKYDLFISKDATTSYVFKKTDPVISVNITGNNNAGEINVAVEVLYNTSSLVKTAPDGIIYKNVNVWAGTYGFATPRNIKHAEILFKVKKSWIESTNINPDSITMLHYHDAWESLPTRKISETDVEIYYEASTTSFSPLAITGKKPDGRSYNRATQKAETKDIQQKEKPVSSDTSQANEPGDPGGLSKYLIIGAVAGIVLNATLIFKVKTSKEKVFNK